MYTSPLSTWRKSSTARLLSRWQAEEHVGLLTACWWIQQTCFCLFVCKLIWFGLVWLSNGINFTGKNNAAQEHVFGSAPFLSTHLYAREEWSGLKWLSLIHSWRGLTTYSWVNFASHEGTETHWDTVLDRLSLATTLSESRSGQGIVTIEVTSKTSKSSF